MKSLLTITLLAIFSFAILPSDAQEKMEPTKKKIKETKKEVKAERNALRKLEGDIVSVKAKSSFYVDFGDIPGAKWKRVGMFDEVIFNKDGKEMKAFYDFDSELVGTTQKKTFDDVPARGQKEIKSKYKDYSIGDVIFFDDNEFNETDMLLYGIQFEDEDNYFVELTKGNSEIVVRVNTRGDVYFFKQL